MRGPGGFTLIELLIVVAIIGVIAAVAVPGLLRARMSGNEAAALAAVKAINSAEEAYAASAGSGGYATSLDTLATPCPGSTQAFISADLSADPSVKSGYTVALAAGAGGGGGGKGKGKGKGKGGGGGSGPDDCNGVATDFAYYASAVPVTFGATGNRSFATNAAGTIWQVAAAAAPAEPFGAPATPIQ